MKNKGRSTAITIVVSLACLIISAQAAVPSDASARKISRPLEYAGYSSPQYKSYGRSSQYVSMFDGTKLAVDFYLPSDGPTDGPFPGLLNYHPYRRSMIDPKSDEIMGIFPGIESFIKFFTSYGYAIVVAEMRGSGASFGSRLDMSPQLAKDGKQIIDWMEMQPWCDGSVGMYGASYQAWSQYAVAAQKPRALKAIMPEVINFDMFSGGLFYCAGIYNRGLTESWGAFMHLIDMAAYIPETALAAGLEGGVFPAAPVVDEDGDGKLGDEIPLDQNGNPFFFDDPPKYSDGEKRNHLYYDAVKEHLNNVDPRQWAPAAPFQNSRIAGSDYTWADFGPGDWPVRLAESAVPMYHVGGWFDVFTLGTTRWYATLKATNPSKMLIHPSFHTSLEFKPVVSAGPYWTYFGEDLQKVADGMLQERLRFFDRYLKGTKNGFDTESPVLIYVMNGEGWRTENEWPLARQVVTTYYLDEQNVLSTAGRTDGLDKYEADFTHDSRYGENKATRWNAAILRDQPMMRTDKDRKCLIYTSEPLEHDTEITGHPIARLWVSSTADYGDFFIYLEDVDEEGEAFYVTEGKLRAGFAPIVPQEDMLPPGIRIDVLPDLPYHGFKDTDYVDRILAGGEPVELVIDLFPTSWVFRKGHQFRISIACADWPTYDLHPKLSPKNDPNDPANTVPTISIWRDAKHRSSIALPIIPPRGK